MGFDEALEAIRSGRPVLVYDFDDRERESDLTVASEFIKPEHIRMMRKEAGGLVCTTMPGALAAEVGMPFMSDVFWDDSYKYPVLGAMAPNDIPYDGTKSSFGVTINHRQTYTGITDNDRALTIAKFVETIFSGKAPEEVRVDMGVNFRSPGHVHLLNSSIEILKDRKGHTELCTALMYLAGVRPSATICEMMGDDGGSRSKESVAEFAQANGIPMVTGDEVIEHWEAFLARNAVENAAEQA